MGKHRTLEGLRAVAVLAVVVHHSQPANTDYFHPLAWGPAGVRLFFVLSGYLITGILLTARDTAETTRTRRTRVLLAFYARRTLRIMPLAYLALLVAWMIGVPALTAHPRAYLTYTSNLHTAIAGHWDPSVGHFWSLAVEEQFYLVWPALILWTPRRRLPIVMLACIIGATLLRSVLIGPSPLAAYVLTVTRLDALALGGLLAWSRVQDRAASTTLLLSIAGVSLTLGLVWPVWTETGLIALCGAVIDAAGRQRLWTPAARVLASRPLVALGGISYGLYVWHPLIPPAVHAIERRFDIWLRFPMSGVPLFVCLSIGAWLAAITSWSFIERPINDLKRFVPYVPTHLGDTPDVHDHAQGRSPDGVQEIQSVRGAVERRASGLGRMEVAPDARHA